MFLRKKKKWKLSKARQEKECMAQITEKQKPFAQPEAFVS